MAVGEGFGIVELIGREQAAGHLHELFGEYISATKRTIAQRIAERKGNWWDFLKFCEEKEWIKIYYFGEIDVLIHYERQIFPNPPRSQWKPRKAQE